MSDTSKSSTPNILSEDFEESIDFKEVWRIIRAHRLMIGIIFVVIVTIGLYLSFTTPPVWEATTTLLIRESTTDPSSFVFDFGAVTSAQRLKNEIEVLKSYSLHADVVSHMIENDLADNNALFGTRYVRKRYRAIDLARSWVTGEEGPIVLPDSLDYSGMIKVIEKLRESTSVMPVRDADVLKVGVESSDSTDAVLLTNLIAERYRAEDAAGGRSEIQFVLTFLDTQITRYEERLRRIERDLEAFQAQNQIYSLDGAAALLLEDLARYEGIYYTNLAELEVAQERVKYLRSQLSESEQQLITEIVNTNNPMIVALREKIAETEARRIQEMVDEGWAENSLQARDYTRRIREMKARLTELTEDLILSGWSEEDPFAASQEIFNRIVEQEVEVHAARSRAGEYEKLVEQMNGRLNNLPSQILEYARLERDRRLNENLYLTMKQKYEESRITEAGERGKVYILDPALIAEKVKPNNKVNLVLSMIVGLALGIGYAFLREFLDDTVKAVEQLERKGLTVIGIIPDIEQGGPRKSKPGGKPKKSGKGAYRPLITHEDPKSPTSEAYRTIRTNIKYSFADRNIKSIVVSSPQPSEGKSTTVANLAIAFAQLKQRTLLIDTDLRKPVQHHVFGLPRGPGVSDYLVGEVEDFDKLIHPTKVENLSLATAGFLPPNPSELLGSKRMGELVDRLENEWDMVLFDSPPIVAVTDASMISGEIDSFVMVVKAAQTGRDAVDRALDTIRNVRAPLIGVILNGVRPESLSGKYSYYYSYYQYYYTEDSEKSAKQKS